MRTSTHRLLLASALLTVPLHAIQPAEDEARALLFPVVAPELLVEPDLTGAGADALRLRNGWTDFFARHGDDWEIRWDARSDRPHLIQGVGIPILPGKGNRLEAAGSAGATTLSDVEARLREFLARDGAILGLEGFDLRLDRERSVAFGDGSTHWFVELAQFQDGLRVEGAYAFFRIVHGNLVQFGTDRIAPVALDRSRAASQPEAVAALWAGLPLAPGWRFAEWVEPAALSFRPVLPALEAPGERFAGLPGTGYDHRLVWRFVFRLADDPTTYDVLVDAVTLSVLEVRDRNVYADALVQGGVYPTTNTDPEVLMPLPFVTVSNGGTKFTNTNGIYDYSGGTATATLNGQFFQMSDACGAIGLSNTVDGNLNFGTNAGTDCTTPGFGGAGNTHSSRTGFHHLTRINRKADLFYPANAWLDSKVTANMNINQTCNAFWNGTSVNFYRSGGGCSNTGEIASVFLHEWGHGMDTNTGGAASENGSGEAVGDTFSFLETRDACIGQNFRPGINCHNCTACTGVRDVGDFDISGPALIAKPSNVTADTGINCDRFTCPYLQQGIFPYQGPMGYEGHCESVIASSANWDLTQLLIAEHGTEPGWAQMDKIWYASLTPSKSAYRLVSGGKCNAAATIDGCAASNWYTAFLPADDDDGNLANGTPNACRIWDAFNAHGIACGVRPVCSSSCATPATADAGLDVEVCAGDPALIGTAALPGHTYLWSPGGATTAQIEVSPASTTVYTVTATTSCDEDQDTVTVTVDDPPAPVADAGPDQAICSGGSVQIGTPAQAGFTYSWSPGGATTAQITVSPADDTVYTVTVDNGCTTAEDAVTVDVISPPAEPELLAPVDGAEHLALPVGLDWSDADGATGYFVEVALDAAFINVVASGNTASSTLPVSGLGPLHYFWHVIASGACEPTAESETFDFTVDSEIFSDGFASEDVSAWSDSVP